MTSLDHHARLRPHLLSGERILWADRPVQGLSFHARDAYLIPAGLLFAGFALMSLRLWRDDGVDPADIVAALLIVAAALYGALFRFVHEAWLRRNILYAVTNQRVLIARGARCDSHDLAWLPMLDLAHEQSGRGTITFDAGEEASSWSLTPKSTLTHGSRFYRIARASSVYELICRASRDRRHELNRDPVAEFIG